MKKVTLEVMTPMDNSLSVTFKRNHNQTCNSLLWTHYWFPDLYVHTWVFTSSNWNKAVSPLTQTTEKIFLDQSKMGILPIFYKPHHLIILKIIKDATYEWKARRLNGVFPKYSPVSSILHVEWTQILQNLCANLNHTEPEF